MSTAHLPRAAGVHVIIVVAGGVCVRGSQLVDQMLFFADRGAHAQHEMVELIAQMTTKETSPSSGRAARRWGSVAV